MKEKYQALLKQIGTLNSEVKSIFDAAGDESLSAEQYKTVTENNRKIEELEHQAKELLDQIGIRESTDRRAAQDSQAVNRLGHSATADTRQRPAATIGEALFQDAEFATWHKKVAANGGVSRAQFGNSPAAQLKTLLTGLSSTSAGAFVETERLGIVDTGTYYRPLRVVDLLTRGSTGSDTVEYVREGMHTNNAAPVPEATATTGVSGTKPESAMLFSVVTEAVKTIAHWIPATRRALADAAQIRTLIDSFLRYGLDEALERQVLNGDGIGENFLGILETPGIQAQAYTTDILVTTRKARTKVLLGGRTNPNAFLMHPLDWEAFDLLKDNESRYYFGGPSVLGNPRLWGLPVVETETIAQGVALTANFRFAALWLRMAAQILVSDSHADFFVRNLIAILAEERAAFGVIRPAAFVEIDLTPT